MDEILNLDVVQFDYNIQFLKSYKNVVNLNKHILNNFLDLGRELKNIKDNKWYEVLNYSSIYDFCKNEFNLGMTTTKNLIAVFERFVDPKSLDYLSPQLFKKFDRYNYSQLVELLPVDDSQLDNFNKSMSVNDIRIKKLENKIKKDEDKVINYFNTIFLENVKNYISKESYLKIKGLENNTIKISVSNKDLKYSYFHIFLKTYNFISLEIISYSNKYTSINIGLDFNKTKEYLDEFIKFCKSELKKLESEKSQLSDSDILEIKEKKSNLKNFKNNDERYNFLKNLENYNLIYSLDLIKVKIYQNKYFEELYIITSLSNDSIYDFFWFSGNYYFFYQTSSYNELYSKLESKEVNLNEK